MFAPLLQRIVVFPLAPVIASEAEPLFTPLQETFTEDGVKARLLEDAFTTAVADPEHPFASVAVTVYVQAASPLIDDAVDPVFQIYV